MIWRIATLNRGVDEIAEFICSALQERATALGVGVAEIDGDFRFFESGVLDSMGFVSLIARLEDHFSAQIDFTELPPEAFSTVNGLAATLAETIGE